MAKDTKIVETKQPVRSMRQRTVAEIIAQIESIGIEEVRSELDRLADLLARARAVQDKQSADIIGKGIAALQERIKQGN